MKRLWTALAMRRYWFLACLAGLLTGVAAVAAKPIITGRGDGSWVVLDVLGWLIPLSALAAAALVGLALLDAFGGPRHTRPGQPTRLNP